MAIDQAHEQANAVIKGQETGATFWGIQQIKLSFLNIWQTRSWNSNMKKVVVTKGSGALCNNIMTDLKELSPCNHEEADTRLFLRVFYLKHFDNSRNFTVIF